MFQMTKDVWSLTRKKLNPVILHDDSSRQMCIAQLLFLQKWWLLSGGAGERGSGEPHLFPFGIGCQAGFEQGG